MCQQAMEMLLVINHVLGPEWFKHIDEMFIYEWFIALLGFHNLQ